MRISKIPVKQMLLVNDDYLGHVEVLRHACRGILVSDGKVLLCHEPESGLYIIPGGGVEGNESYEECCVREVLDEDYHDTDLAIFGLYKREHAALTEYEKFITEG